MSIADHFPRDVPDVNRPYVASADRYDHTSYRQVGQSGLFLPPISLGLWWNFGDNVPFDNQRTILRHAFDRGITHFDLANNYGPPIGAAESNFGRMIREDFAPYRNEIVVSSKAGWGAWPGPYGNFASRQYLLASAEGSLRRLSLDHLDIFYSHRPDPVTPIAETIGALDELVRSGKTRYVGISAYNAEQTAAAVTVARDLGTPLVIHQPPYSILNREIEGELLPELRADGLGAIAFVPLAQGLLTNKYLTTDAAARGGARSSAPRHLNDQSRQALQGLADVAAERGQSLAQMAIQWVIRDRVVASALIGASSVAQLDENLGALNGPDFSEDQLWRIGEIAGGFTDSLWA